MLVAGVAERRASSIRLRAFALDLERGAGPRQLTLGAVALRGELRLRPLAFRLDFRLPSLALRVISASARCRSAMSSACAR